MLDLFLKGGPVMFILLLCSIVGLFIVFYKVLYLRMNRVNHSDYIAQVKNSLVTNGIEKTIQDLRIKRDITSKIIVCAIKLSTLPREEIQEGIKEASYQELPKLDRHMDILSSIITVAPILGLLGTVLGLMDIFHVISGGNLGDPTLLASGIAEALITTVTGLAIAIPFIFLFQFLNQKIDVYVINMERILNELLNFTKLNRGIKP